MKKFWIVFVVLVVVIGGSLGLLWRAVNNIDAGPAITGGVLVWEVSGVCPEKGTDSFIDLLLNGQALEVNDVVFALKRAADDTRITGLVLAIDSLPVDWAKVEEFRGAVARFKESGKPVIAYIESGGAKEYALAVGADEVVLAPEGSLLVLGVSAELSFIKGTLGKLGMEADFIHVGKYKSAPESMTREAPSEAAREMTEAIVDSRYEHLIAMIAAGRSVSDQQARSWVDRGMFDSATALEQGLIDTVMYEDSLLDTRFGDETITHLSDYAFAGGSGRPIKKIAMIFAVGTIMPGESRSSNLQGQIVGSQTVVEQLRDAREDDSIAAVLLRVDSPGGSALASDLIWHEMVMLRQEKPVVVSMSGYAASGGYYISCFADSIFAQNGTLTGSIGVFAGKVNMHEMYNKLGVQREYITRGENAQLFGNDSKFSGNQREMFQTQLDEFYQRFVAKVADGRNLTWEQVHEVAQGRVWTGDQAVAAGLVDGAGGLGRALSAIKLMIGVDPADKVSIVTYGKELSFMQRMIIRSFNEVAMFAVAQVPTLLQPLVDPMIGQGVLATAALLDGRPVAMMPFRIEFR